jgi:hypothetical protein
MLEVYMDMIRKIDVRNEHEAKISKDREDRIGTNSSFQEATHVLLAHSIVVRMEQSLKQVLLNRIWQDKWTNDPELSQFDVSFEPQKALKAHVFDRFLAKLTPGNKQPCPNRTVFTDESSNNILQKKLILFYFPWLIPELK